MSNTKTKTKLKTQHTSPLISNLSASFDMEESDVRVMLTRGAISLPDDLKHTKKKCKKRKKTPSEYA